MQENARLSLPASNDKAEIVTILEDYAKKLGLNILSIDLDKPWGFEFYIDPADIALFTKLYYSSLPADSVTKYRGELQPKFLIVAPGMRFSWQYHERRAEVWCVAAGPVGLITSADDNQGDLQILEQGQTIEAEPLTRHRLVGLTGWGVVAEIWQHTDSTNPSDKSDITRISDDFNR